MITLGFSAAKAGFFDAEAIMKVIDSGSRKALSATGAAVRRTAQRSIKIVPGPSRPGEVPHGHATGTRKRKSKSTGRVRVQSVSPLREFIFFSYDVATRSVIVGPAKLSGLVGGGAPAALEYGGTSTARRAGRPVQESVRPRPFMRPALAEVLPNLPTIWRSAASPA